jgi:hypothetical protein
MLKPGGQLYIEAPDADTLSRRQCGPYWYLRATPRYLCLFSPDTLRYALNEVGLQVRQLRMYLFKSLYSWEDTYRQEEAAQRRLGMRTRMHLAARPRALALGAGARPDQLLHRLSGDIICC